MYGVVATISPCYVLAGGIIWPPLCAIIVMLRFYTRKSQGVRLMMDDWLTIPAAVITAGLGTILIYGVYSKALGYPTPPPDKPKDALTNSDPQIRTNRLLVWIFFLAQVWALTCVKLSFIFFYRRIFCTGVGKSFHYVTVAAIIVIVTWGLAFEFAYLFICRGHFSAYWDSIQSLQTHCRPELDMEIGFACTDFITDVIVFVLPLPLIWKLQMSPKRKIATTIVFCLGLLAVAASITRMVILIRAVQTLKTAFVTYGANNQVTTAGLYWSMVESSLGLISACLPTIYSLFKKRSASDKSKRKHPITKSLSADVPLVSSHHGLKTKNIPVLKGAKPLESKSSNCAGNSSGSAAGMV